MGAGGGRNGAGRVRNGVHRGQGGSKGAGGGAEGARQGVEELVGVQREGLLAFRGRRQGCSRPGWGSGDPGSGQGLCRGRAGHRGARPGPAVPPGAAPQRCGAGLRFDLATLPVDFVECLMRFLPTEAEAKALRQYERERKPLEELADEDRFMLQFSKVERLPQRMAIMAFLGNFAENVQMLTPVWIWGRGHRAGHGGL